MIAGLRLAGHRLRRATRRWRSSPPARRRRAAVRVALGEQVMMLVGGDDTMTYEGYARDILLNGILMSGGQPLGQGEPFYYQAFYPYFLAAMHACSAKACSARCSCSACSPRWRS